MSSFRFAAADNPDHHLILIPFGSNTAETGGITACAASAKLIGALAAEFETCAQIIRAALTAESHHAEQTAELSARRREAEEYQSAFTAFRRAEERYKQIIDTAMDAVISSDENGIISSWNAQAVSMFGLSRSEALGTNISRIIPQDFRTEHSEEIRVLQEDGVWPILGRCVELRGRRANGVEFPIELTVHRIYSDGPISYTAYLRDITLRNEAEHKLSRLYDELEQRVLDRITHELERPNKNLSEEIRVRQQVTLNLQESKRRLSEQAAALQEALAAAREASRLKSEFVARMSHEIRTPLNAVLGMTGLLMDTQLNDTQHDLAEDVRTSAETLLLLINDILDFSKIEAGKLTIEAVPFDLSTAVNDVVEMVGTRAKAAGIDLVVRFEPGMPCELLGDAWAHPPGSNQPCR